MVFCLPGNQRFTILYGVGRSASLVYFAAITDVVKINAAKFQIEFIKHAPVADTKFEFRAALQPFVREILKPRSHFINLALDRFTDAGRHGVERL
jgi:hypothetical protein